MSSARVIPEPPSLLAVAAFIWRRPESCLYAAAAALLLLMVIGIHNAWDIAVFNSVTKRDDPS